MVVEDGGKEKWELLNGGSGRKKVKRVREEHRQEEVKKMNATHKQKEYLPSISPSLPASLSSTAAPSFSYLPFQYHLLFCPPLFACLSASLSPCLIQFHPYVLLVSSVISSPVPPRLSSLLFTSPLLSYLLLSSSLSPEAPQDSSLVLV